MSLRTIEYAARHDIILSQNEIGMLFITQRDIDPLIALFDACNQVRYRMHHEMQTLQRELLLRAEEGVRHGDLGEPVRARGPIRRITHRAKRYDSLFRKLVDKEAEMEREAGRWRFQLEEMKGRIENLSKYGEAQGVARGPVSIFLEARELARAVGGGGPVQAQLAISGHLGVVDDVSRVYLGEDGSTLRQTAHIEEDDRRKQVRNKALVWRILKLYEVDDIAGIRLECDYLSDIEEVLDALRARYGEDDGDIRLRRVDRAIDNPKRGGYRGVHITVDVKVESLVGNEECSVLERVLECDRDETMTLPCEIQIRTGYQQSWSEKSHDLTYKREQSISKQLLEPIRLLADQLYEAEQLADIVRQSIEMEFLPTDYGERALLDYLRKVMTREGFAFVEFGLHFAKRKHENDLRYGGRPQFSHILEVCQRIVFRFRVLNPELLLLVAVHDIWMGRRSEFGRHASTTREVQRLFMAMLEEDKNFPVLKDRFKGRGVMAALEKAAAGLNEGTDDLDWFWRVVHVMHWSWVQLYGGDAVASGKEVRRRRIQWLVGNVLQVEGVLDHEMARQYGLILEAALQLGRFEELAEEQNLVIRERAFQELYRELLLIRQGLRSSHIKTRIVEEADRTCVTVARRLGVSIPLSETE